MKSKSMLVIGWFVPAVRGLRVMVKKIRDVRMLGE